MVLCSYYYKKFLDKNLEFFVNDDFDLFINYYSIYKANKVEISFQFSNKFVEGVHYKDSTNLEAIEESVGSNFIDYFTIKANNHPITDIFRIYNKTTGEVYQPVSTFNNQIRFSGSKSPEFVNIEKEKISFQVKNNELLDISNNLFYNKYERKVSSASNGKIDFDSIAETFNSDIKYYIVSKNRELYAEVKEFIVSGDSTVGAKVSESAGFIFNEEIYISFYISEINLKSRVIMGEDNSVGNHLNTSLKLNKSIFKREIPNDSSVEMKEYGDYKVNYRDGIIYAAINKAKPESCSYKYSSFKTKYPRVFSINDIFYIGSKEDLDIEYTKDGNIVTIDSIPESIEFFNEKKVMDGLRSKMGTSLIVREDKTILTNESYGSINYLDKYENLLNPEKNYYDSSKHSYSKNVIDLKVSHLSKFYIEEESYSIKTNTKAEKIFKIKNNSNGDVIYNNGYFTKFSFVKKSSTHSEAGTKIYISSRDIDRVSLLDKVNVGDKYYSIDSINPVSNYIKILEKIDSFTEGSIVRVISETLELGAKKVEIPWDLSEYLDLEHFYEIIYFEDDGISVGDKLFLEFKVDDMLISYTYVKDDIYVSYQYGDNTIDWSISDSLAEGETYYVSYEYGALRSQLRKNFGTLTEIPFFNNFELNVDREFYRDALEGTLQSFANGPIIDSYNNLIENIVDTSPEISESFYRGWVLGSDHLKSNKIEYSDGIIFDSCRYKEGLRFSGDAYTSISSDNKLPISEGTVSLWATNDWEGIENDSDIEFSIDNVGLESYSYDKDLDIRSSSGSRIYLNKDSVSILNYKDGSRGEAVSTKKIKYLSPGCTLDLKFDFRIEDSDDYNFYSKNLFNFIINDKNKCIDFEVGISYFGGESPISFLILDLDYVEAPNLSKKTPEISCSCIYPKAKDIFGFIDSKIDIIFNSAINIKDSLPESHLNIDEKYFVESAGGIFEIESFIDLSGNKVPASWAENIKGIVIPRRPFLSKASITKNFEPENFLVPGDGFKIFTGRIKPVLKNSKSYSILGSKKGFLVNPFKANEVSLVVDSDNNNVSIAIGQSKDNLINHYYSDFFDVSDINTYKPNVSNIFAGYIKDFSGIHFCSLNKLKDTSINLKNIKYELKNLLGLKDIYIGKDSRSPNKGVFKLSGDDKSLYGIPKEHSSGKPGIFIYKDEYRKDEYFHPAKDNWVLKVSNFYEVKFPDDVKSLNEYSYSYFKIEDKIGGRILSESDFYKTAFTKNLNKKLSKNNSMSLRYLSGSILDDGWNDISKSFSDEINVAIDGVSTSSYSWFSKNEIKSETNLEGNLFLTEDENQRISTKVISFSEKIEYEITSKVSLDLSKLVFKINENDSSFYTGIKPIHINLDEKSISLEYIVLDGKQAILVGDESEDDSIGIIYCDWNNSNLKIKLILDKNLNDISIKINGLLKLKKEMIIRDETYPAVISSVLRAKNFYLGDYNFAISKIEYKTNDIEVITSEYDLLEIGSNYIEFKFRNKTLDDGYGYKEEDNELLFVSEKEKVLLESASEESSLRLYKDGFGYINFEIIDKDRVYKISYDVKDIPRLSLSHIAAAWAINETDNKMSLYFNGNEVPKIYTLGSNTPIFSDERFGDVSKEKLQDKYFSLINHSDAFIITTLAGTNLGSSDSADISMVGRHLDIEDSLIYPDLIGACIYISKILDGQLYFKNGITDEDYIFSTSSEVTARLAPIIGLENSLITNLSDDSFKVYKEGLPLVGKSSGESNFNFIPNIDENYIEFLGINDNCKYSSSISKSDEVHVRTYGLDSYSIDCNVEITESIEDVSYIEKYNFLMSKVNTNLPMPKTLSGVKIYKVFEENLVPEFNIVGNFINWDIEINHSFESKIGRYKVSSFDESSKGKALEIEFFSYNIDFSNGPIELEVFGDGGSTYEKIHVNKNGKYHTESKFREIDSIKSSFSIIDPDEDPASISIKEFYPITKSDVKIFKYSDGFFIIGKNGEEYESYGLTKGIYNFKYNSKLDIESNKFGEELFIGNSSSKKNAWGGAVEEFKISSNYYTEPEAKIEFLATKPFCPNSKTMCLIPFNDPFDYQKDRLRKEVFLGVDNFKFSLSDDEVSELSYFLNKKSDFIRKIMSMGISKDIAEKTYFKCHKANGGPITDISNFNPSLKNNGNRAGPNENFAGSMLVDKSGIEIDTSSKVLNEKEFAVNTWISPLFDSDTNNKKRYIFSASNIRESVVRASNNSVTIPQKASSILRIEAVTKDGDSFLRDSKIYGKYSIYGATGSLRDFSNGCKILNDERTVKIKDVLPRSDSYYKVYFSPKSESAQSISLYLDKNSEIVLEIKSPFKDIKIAKELGFKYLNWYKVLLTYNDKRIKLFVNGEKIIDYFNEKIIFSNYFGKINFMSNEFGEDVFNGKISSTKILREAKGIIDSGSREKDINYFNKYSDNREMVADDYTTYINNFEFDLLLKDNFSEVIDKKSGIFDFEVDISDPFNKLDKDYKKDLVEYLVNRIKPAHSNSIVRVKNNRC